MGANPNVRQATQIAGQAIDLALGTFKTGKTPLEVTGKLESANAQADAAMSAAANAPPEAPTLADDQVQDAAERQRRRQRMLNGIRASFSSPRGGFGGQVNTPTLLGS